MIWNKQYECLDREKLEKLQAERLAALVSYAGERSPFYKKKIAQHKVRAEDIKTIEDIKKLPFTTKDDLRDNYPFGIFSQPVTEINELHVSSGTTGNPTVVGYAESDLELWGEVMARALCCAGAETEDMIQIAYGYGLFTGGLGVHYGARKMGLTVIPASSGQTKRQLKLMQDFKPRILACTPSYALFMAETAKDLGLDPRKSNWQIGIFGAEPWSESMRRSIEEEWNIIATDIYGLSEIIGPGVAQECTYKQGLHIFSDVFFPEVIDPVTGKEQAEGKDGELVVTTLTKRGMPVIRYRTRDIVSITYQTCACGRTSPRISKVKGRTDDMIIVRGINVFPSQIEHVLLNLEETQPHYQLIVDRKESGLDDLEVQVEIKEEFFSDEVKQLRAITAKIQNEINSVLGLSARVRLVEPRSLARSEGKAKRVIDKRKK